MIKSEVYRLTRTELARVASEEYVRTFWWFVATIPVFGVLAVAFGSGALQFIGMMGIIWPFSIPARSVLSTSKSSRLFTAGCHVEVTNDSLVFIGELNGAKRLRYQVEFYRLKMVIRRRDMLIVRTRLPGFLPIKVEAFANEKALNRFIKAVETKIDEALQGESKATLP